MLVCGSREWKDADAVYLACLMEPREQGWGDAPVRLIHGGARGADRMAGVAGIQLGYEVKAFPAEWEMHGKRAGILRNLQMLDEQPDLVIAFGSGRGTDHTCREAERRGIPVRRF